MDSEAQAYLEMMLMVMASDGNISESEVRELAMQIASRPKLRKYSPEEIQIVMNTILQNLTKQGLEARLNLLPGVLLTPESRIDAMRTCLSVCAADGRVANEELVILSMLQKVLGMSEQQLKDLIDEFKR